MSGLGRAGAYFALFSQVGLILLVTNLGGALLGHWADEQLVTCRSSPSPASSPGSRWVGWRSSG